MSAGAIINVQNLSKTLGGNVILNDVTFEVGAGEILAVLGPSGTGKTVLLKHLVGLMEPDAGNIVVDGDKVNEMTEHNLLGFRRKIGFLFQEGALYDFMDVCENVSFPLREHTEMDKDAINARVNEVLALVDMDGSEHKMPSELSGGMKKRVALARAIVLKPKILLCDEPTSGLDPIRSRDISDLLRQVSKKIGSCAIFTSHDVDNALRIADRIMVLNEGRIAVIGNKEEVLKAQAPFVREFLHKEKA